MKQKEQCALNGQSYSIWKRRILALLDELNVLKEEGKAERMTKSEIIQYFEWFLLSFAQGQDKAKYILNHLDSIY